MTTAILEKVYLRYIMENPSLLGLTEPHFFKNKDVRFVFQAFKGECERRTDRSVPTMQELVEVVKSKDVDNDYSNDLLKSILKVDMEKYTAQFIEPRIDLWLRANRVQTGMLEGIELLRLLGDELDLDKQMEILDELRDKLVEANKRAHVSNDMGIDFDDPDAHDQDTATTKIPTQWQTMNTLMGGGWDRKTLNVLMGETNVGKSAWMHNIAAGAADIGYNVLIVSLEMSEKKVVKRLGSIRLGIPVSEYDDLSKDREYVARKIEEHKAHVAGRQSLFSERSAKGKIFIKEFPNASLTVGVLEAYIKKLEDVSGLKMDMVLVDYIGIMAPEKAAHTDGNLYLKGKHLAEGLRAIAQKLDVVMVTATQLSRTKFGANDIGLMDMPESKAIAETADTVFAIIRTPAMKVSAIYHLKALKLRDNEFIYERMAFDFNTTYLRIGNDQVYRDSA